MIMVSLSSSPTKEIPQPGTVVHEVHVHSTMIMFLQGCNYIVTTMLQPHDNLDNEVDCVHVHM